MPPPWMMLLDGARRKERFRARKLQAVGRRRANGKCNRARVWSSRDQISKQQPRGCTCRAYSNLSEKKHAIAFFSHLDNSHRSIRRFVCTTSTSDSDLAHRDSYGLSLELYRQTCVLHRRQYPLNYGRLHFPGHTPPLCSEISDS
jgi:hypothetical protein